MQKVLLAVEGIRPDGKAFNYALELCKRMRAELNVLEVINPRKYLGYLKKLGDGAQRMRQYFEDSMVAATFAEAGEHEMAEQLREQAMENFRKLLPQSEKVGVPCHLTMKSGRTDREIIDYVNAHRDIVVTIYDGEEGRWGFGGNRRKRRRVPPAIRKNISTPLVVING